MHWNYFIAVSALRLGQSQRARLPRHWWTTRTYLVAHGVGTPSRRPVSLSKGLQSWRAAKGSRGAMTALRSDPSHRRTHLRTALVLTPCQNDYCVIFTKAATLARQRKEAGVARLLLAL